MTVSFSTVRISSDIENLPICLGAISSHGRTPHRQTGTDRMLVSRKFRLNTNCILLKNRRIVDIYRRFPTTCLPPGIDFFPQRRGALGLYL